MNFLLCSNTADVTEVVVSDNEMAIPTTSSSLAKGVSKDEDTNCAHEMKALILLQPQVSSTTSLSEQPSDPHATLKAESTMEELTNEDLAEHTWLVSATDVANKYIDQLSALFIVLRSYYFFNAS